MNRLYIRDRLRAGECLVGCFVQTPSLAVAEVLATSGFDLLVPDAEHAPLTPLDIQTIIAGAHLHGIPALVRVAGAEQSAIQYALDAGAAGVIVPYIETAEQAQAVCDLARYAPQGRRGSGPGRASLYGLDRIDGVHDAAAHTLVSVQIESKRGVENLASILAVDGIDMVFVGPNDLSLSLGNPDAAELQAVIEGVLSTAHAQGVMTGILAPTGELAKTYREMGVHLLLTGTDLGMLATQARTVSHDARAKANQ